MSYQVKELNVKSTDGIHTLKGKIYIPSGEIKGLFHVVHGMTEYIDRYKMLFEAIANEGYICFGVDNLGHGKSTKDESELGFIARKNGYKYLVDDVLAVANEVKKEYPDKKYILMGHSMGSFIVRLAAPKFNGDISKLIVCGTAGPNPACDIGLFMIDVIKLIKGEKAHSLFTEGIIFGAYNKRFKENSKFAWLTKDSAVIDAYENDKYCNFHFTLSALRDLVTLNKLCNLDKWYNDLRKDLPTLLIAGDNDPVGDYGKGVKKVFDRLIKTGHTANIILYENCRHEILKDSLKEKVISDILEFINM